MVARKALGAEGESFEIDIERGKIDEFARAVHATHPHHFNGREVVIPATFLTTMFFWEKRVPGSNPWDLIKMSEERGMHAEQEYIFHGPPPKAGDRLIASSTITELYDKERRSGGTLTFVKMTTAFRDPETGHLRAEAILTGVERQ
ncbi:MAG: dehydratase [Rhodobacterales bacterium]|nr:dehydratase [Rhodobacterales bacterium]